MTWFSETYWVVPRKMAPTAAWQTQNISALCHLLGLEQLVEPKNRSELKRNIIFQSFFGFNRFFFLGGDVCEFLSKNGQSSHEKAMIFVHSWLCSDLSQVTGIPMGLSEEQQTRLARAQLGVGMGLLIWNSGGGLGNRGHSFPKKRFVYWLIISI